MSVEIRLVEYCNIPTAMKLIEEVFDKFVAPDYSLKGIKTFKENFIYNQNFLDKFADGREKMVGAFEGDHLIGCLSISIHNTISCVFVRGEYHRKGIGKRLLDTVIEDLRMRDVDSIQLNASPYAIQFYHAMGFEDIGKKGDYNGIIYTPMKLMIN